MPLRPRGLRIPSEVSLRTMQIKIRLLEMVSEEGVSVHQASIQLSINYSTVKLIVRKYRKTGQLPAIVLR